MQDYCVVDLQNQWMDRVKVGVQAPGRLGMSNRNQSCCLESAHNLRVPLPPDGYGRCGKGVIGQRIVIDGPLRGDVQRPVASWTPLLERVHTYLLVGDTHPGVAPGQNMLGRLKPIVLAVVALRDV